MVEGEPTTEVSNVDRYSFLKYAHLSPAVVEEAEKRGVPVKVIVEETRGLINRNALASELDLYYRKRYERGEE